MAVFEDWGRIRVLDEYGTHLGTWLIEGTGHPELTAVEQVARLQLLARRLGGTAVLDSACDELVELIDLSGLPVEMQRQTEDGEDRLGVQEGVQPGDPTA